MAFSDRLQDALRETGITQAQLSRMTGIGKSSISQYLSGEQVPLKKRVAVIADALGVDAKYFNGPTQAPLMRTKRIRKLPVAETARLLGMSERTVRQGLQDGVFPWGYAIHGEGDKWTYFINARRFAEIEKVEMEETNV